MAVTKARGEHPRICTRRIVGGGLANRAGVILTREEALFPTMLTTVAQGRAAKGGKAAGRALSVEMLEQGLHSTEVAVSRAAAFLAGRCQPEASEDRRRLTALLKSVIDSLPVDNLDIMARTYVEAAMSLALRGELETARRALLPVVSEQSSTNQRYLAAFYLAQLGDPSGYPAMLKALHSSLEHERLMAVRHLVGFKPFDGQTVAGTKIDIRGQFLERLRDRDPSVRAEVPFLLEEAGIGGLRNILLPVAKQDRNKEVRWAAGVVIERLQGD